jgi:hypothetical protein
MSVVFLANGYSTFAQILFCKLKASVYLDKVYVFMTLSTHVFVFTAFQEGRNGAVNMSELLCVTIYAYNPVITCSSSYLRLQVIQSKYLLVIGNNPRRIPTSHLHTSLNIEPNPVLIHRLTDELFAHCHLHPNLVVQQIGNYTPADLNNLYKKYKHNRTKHILL